LLSDNIRAARKAAGLTQHEAADVVGTGLAHYGRLERGDVDPRVSTLLRVAAGLGVPVAELLRGLDVRVGETPVLDRESSTD
jgi:transcriptional regulator with XRE-family HTH domain